jgi:hypothetical protein
MFRRILLPVLAAAAGLLALAGPASALPALPVLPAPPPVTAAVGPIPLPKVPLKVCVGTTCVATPAATSLKLDIGVKVGAPGLVLLPPTVLPVPCPGGALGAGVRVTAGSAGAVLSGKVTVTANGAPPVVVPLDRTLAPSSPPLTINACVGA